MVLFCGLLLLVREGPITWSTARASQKRPFHWTKTVRGYILDTQ